MRRISFLLLASLLLVTLGCSTTTAPTPAAPIASLAPTANCPCLKVYTLPDAGMKMITDAIDSAQKSVRLKMYLFTEPQVTEALRRAALRKVETRVLMELNPFGGGASNLEIEKALKDTGVRWQWTDRNAYRYTHEKSLVIDDKVAYIMTHNFAASSFTSNREYGVIDTHPADVAEIIRVYEADWNYGKPDLSNARLVWSPVNARERILALIDEAKTSIDMQQSSMLDEEIGNHLINAIKRGVKLRLVSSPGDVIEDDENERQKEQLRKAGADVRYMVSPYVHAKMYLIDSKKAFLGSVNNSTNSMDNNRELGIIFDETAAVVTVAQTFEKDFARATKEPYAVSAVPTPATGIVNWKDAANFYNRTVTIEGTVVKTYNSGRVLWLQFGVGRTDMKVVIFPQDWPKFRDVPDKLYEGKKIRVRGRVQNYQDAPEMIIRDPKDIEVVQ